MNLSAQNLKNNLAAFQLYGPGVLPAPLIEKLFTIAIEKAEAGEAVEVAVEPPSMVFGESNDLPIPQATPIRKRTKSA